MTNQICIDFGTSSIRAAVSYEGKIYPLKVAIQSPIDNASIPSAILVTKDGENVLFGHEAVMAAPRTPNILLYETSPKKWLLSEPHRGERIDLPVAPNHKYTKRNLLEVFVALSIQQSYKAATELLSLKHHEKNCFGLRISHPSWDEEAKSKKNEQYHSLLEIAASLARSNLSWCMSGPQIDLLNYASKNTEPISIQDIEVEEPIAAAVSLFGGFPKNKRAIALIIDIGAGTIDLGVFSMVVPDNAAIPTKLKQWAKPRSLVGAGDSIDAALIAILRTDQLTENTLIQFKNRIRQNKEMLFNRGEIVIGNSYRISLRNLTETTTMRGMALKLENAIYEMLTESTKRLSIQTQSDTHRLEEVYAVFAGGGANIQFLRDAVTRAIYRIPGIKVNYDFQQSIIDINSLGVDASIERMAVALGGSISKSLWPDSEVKTPLIKGWEYNPKQKF